MNDGLKQSLESLAVILGGISLEAVFFVSLRNASKDHHNKLGERIAQDLPPYENEESSYILIL